MCSSCCFFLAGYLCLMLSEILGPRSFKRYFTHPFVLSRPGIAAHSFFLQRFFEL